MVLMYKREVIGLTIIDILLYFSTELIIDSSILSIYIQYSRQSIMKSFTVCDAAAVRSSTTSSFNKCFFVNSP